jgi:hypothetical protein
MWRWCWSPPLYTRHVGTSSTYSSRRPGRQVPTNVDQVVSFSELERSAITGAASIAARVRFAEITWLKGSELGAGPLRIAHQGFIENDAEIARPLPHLLQGRAPAAEQVDEGHAFGVEELEGKPQPFGRILMRAKTSAASASRSSLRRRLPLWSRSAMANWARASLASPVPWRPLPPGG